MSGLVSGGAKYFFHQRSKKNASPQHTGQGTHSQVYQLFLHKAQLPTAV